MVWKLGRDLGPGTGLGGVCRLPGRCPACRRREPGPGSCTERENLSPRHCPGRWPGAGGSSPSGTEREGSSTVAGHGGRASRSSGEARYCGWSEGDGSFWFAWWSTGVVGMSQVSGPESKSFEISEQVVFEAYRRVRAHKGGGRGRRGVGCGVRGRPEGQSLQAVECVQQNESGCGLRISG